MDLRIEYLAQHPTVMPIVADWLFRQWPHFNPGATYDDVLNRIQEKQPEDQILPVRLVAFLGSQPIGTASLVSDDMATPEDYSPWLASVYVVPEERKRGIGSALVRAAIQKIGALGVKTLYLYTPDKVTFYEHLGWSKIRETEHFGIDVTIMKYDCDMRPEIL
jgi:GNAT superfamily N-acetyltransferase